ncbi:MAG: MBL fold metallo-hydrolase [Ruminococcaceae bacterium]|nr:MBL fold metallo-hydrolase [Oscillospiraceae bacterium]
MARKGKNSISKVVAVAIVALMVFLVGFLQDKDAIPENVNPVSNGEIFLHIIDVGQGSSTLIQKGNEGILIDAGEADYAQTVIDYINSCGITNLSYVVASHPHSDHIGGLPKVLDAFKVGEVLMPEIAEENLPTTKVYERFLDAIVNNDISASYCEVGDVYSLDGISMEILGPVKQIDDLNNMSAICKVTYGEIDTIILGDAEVKEIKSVYSNGGDFESEILVMGHHGSRTSIHDEFLKAVNPEVALISCGKDNSYGHPHKETISYLETNGIDYLRTDEVGSIVYRLDIYGYERTEK